MILTAPFAKDALHYYYAPPPGVTFAAPRTIEQIPRELDLARRVIYVQGYRFSAPDLMRELRVGMERSRTGGPPVLVSPGAVSNPWHYWMADISITVYDRTAP